MSSIDPIDRTRLQAPARAPAPDFLRSELERALHDLVARKQVHHAVLAVERTDGSFRWVGAAGKAHPDGTPMLAETPFWLASVTKLYIAAAVLRYWEQGRIDLDAPMVHYLPASLTEGVHRLGGIDHSGEVTVRHLLTHASGLPDYLECRAKGEPSLMERILDGDLSWSGQDAMRIVREHGVPHFAPQPLEAPRYKIRYSDTNYQLLIEILEAISGRPLQVVFEKTLFEPLGLTETYLPDTVGDPPVRPATVWAGDQPLHVPRALRSFRDLYGTAAEVLRFMRALAEGRVFDDPATLQRMRGPWRPFGFSLNPTPLGPTWPIQYALGTMRLQVPRVFTPTKALPAVMGHTGVAGSWSFHCPELGIVLAGTVSQMNAGALPFRFVPRLLPLFEGAAR